MTQDSAGLQAGSPGGGAAAAPQTLDYTHDLVYCRCGHPLHPARLEERHGVNVERYTCPLRRWWNGWHHPHAWLAAREGVPS